MTQTLEACQITTIDKPSTGFAKIIAPLNSQSNSQRIPKQLRAVIANLEKQDIGWIDILSTMANIVEQRGDDQLPEALEAAALTLKRNRKVIRNL